MLNEIMAVLTPNRMMSVGNLALHFEMEPAALHPQLERLVADGRIRYAQSRCSGLCSTCSTCTVSSSGVVEETAPAVNPSAIVISLEIRRQDA